MSGPPDGLVNALLRGPSLVTRVDWHEEVDSTMRIVAEAAREGADPGLVVVADIQTAGRGRLGRSWSAPPGTSLLASWLLEVPGESSGLVPLVAGTALADVARGYVDGAAEVALKWPNDLLVGGTKCAGLIAERVGDRVVLGTGVNVDWTGVARPEELAGATSLAEAAGAPIDRWRVFAAIAGVLTNRLADAAADPGEAVASYRERCATLGREVRIELPGGEALVGMAVDVDATGRLLIDLAGGERRAISAGDVTHVRPA